MTDNPEEHTPEPVEHAETDTAPNPNAEAAKYRRRLRNTEAQLEAAQGRLIATQTALAEELARTVGRIEPAAIWAAGVELDDLLDDTGAVDPEKVINASDQTASLLKIARRPKPDPMQGYTGGIPADTWETAFKMR